MTIFSLFPLPGRSSPLQFNVSLYLRPGFLLLFSLSAEISFWNRHLPSDSCLRRTRPLK